MKRYECYLSLLFHFQQPVVLRVQVHRIRRQEALQAVPARQKEGRKEAIRGGDEQGRQTGRQGLKAKEEQAQG